MIHMVRPLGRRRAVAGRERPASSTEPQDAIIDIALTGVVSSWNQAAAVLYGYPAEEIIGLAANVLCPAEGRGDEAAVLQRVIAAGRIERYEADRVCKDLTVIPVSVTAAPVLGPQAQLLQAQRLESLGQLAGGVAHDFNNLLAVILSYASFVSEELATPAGPDWPERLDNGPQRPRADHPGRRTGGGLTRQLLTFARREVVRPQVLDLDTSSPGCRKCCAGPSASTSS
jgi:two-component system cell cycle sensor histidine kinase/response regulator CckA